MDGGVTMNAVCEMCGAVGYEQLLLCCDDCKRAHRHQYCLDKVLYDGASLEKWFCDECNQRHNEGSHSKSLEQATKEATEAAVHEADEQAIEVSITAEVEAVHEADEEAIEVGITAEVDAVHEADEEAIEVGITAEVDAVHEADEEAIEVGLTAEVDAVHEADEEAIEVGFTVEVEADISEEDYKIERLELSQLSQADERVKVNYKGPNAVCLRKSLNNKRPNFYEMERTSKDGRFWSCEQEDFYTSVYTKNGFTLSNWINWEEVEHSKDKELEEFEKNFRQVGLHTLLSRKQDWHEQTIRQFFSTFYIDPNGNFLTWMTGMNRKITVTKKFCQKVLLDPADPAEEERNEQRNEKLKTKLLPAEEEVVNNANGDLKNLILRVLDRSIVPRVGNRNNTKKWTKVLIYHFLTGKPFDFVDLMFSCIQETRSDTRRFMPYAPFIMLLINRATNEESMHVSEGFKEHKVYDMTEMKPEQRLDKAKPAKQDRVPPLSKRQRLDKSKPKQDSVPPLTKRQRLR